MTQLAGIFGYPLAHSMSPVIQQAAFDYHSLPARYEAWPTPPDELAGEVTKLRKDRYLGANVTVPHKERVMAHLDRVDPAARTIGAVNTIAKEDGLLAGYNTDVYGFTRSVKEILGLDLGGVNALVLGAGGAARAGVFALIEEGVASVVIANRTEARARSLAADAAGRATRVTACSWAEMAGSLATADLIVNSTSLGMRHAEGEGVSPLAGKVIPRSALVMDMVYNPMETPLLLQAAESGARTLGGLWMLVYQGAAAFERWTGLEAPVEVMLGAAQEALTAG